MISQFTPPGSRVICIEAPFARVARRYKLTIPKVGAAYTIGNIYEAETYSGFAVVVPELKANHGYCLSLFELAALPKAITDCLETVDLPLIIEEFKREDADAAMRLLLPYA
jgi:hypothetical protein